MLERINKSQWYTIQVNKSTNVANKATVLVFVQYIFQEDVPKDMLCALLLPTNVMAAQLFKSLNDSMSGKLNLSFCISICTNRRAAMIGQFSDFTTQVREIASECEFTHCIIHREILWSQMCHLNLKMFCRM